MLLKNNNLAPNRPLTSKSQRSKLGSREKQEDFLCRVNNVEADDFLGGTFFKEDKKIADKVLISTTSSSKKGLYARLKGQRASIDPEFLSLFAD